MRLDGVVQVLVRGHRGLHEKQLRGAVVLKRLLVFGTSLAEDRALVFPDLVASGDRAVRMLDGLGELGGVGGGDHHLGAIGGVGAPVGTNGDLNHLAGIGTFTSLVGGGVLNGANTNAAVRTYTAGLGYSGFFTINNALSTSPGLYSQTNGSGAAIYGENSGNGDGFAGLFQILAATNTYPAIQASSDGLGPGLRIMQSTGTGGGVDILMQNVASTAPGLRVEQQGQSDAITAITSGTGPGSAGRFEVTNPSSSAIALWTT